MSLQDQGLPSHKSSPLGDPGPSVLPPSPSNSANVLNFSPNETRSNIALIAEGIKRHLLGYESVLNRISEPIMKARVAVIVLQQFATELLPDLSPQKLGKVWSEALRKECREAVAAFKSAFSLDGDVLQGFREKEP